jgi:hypothetical protein
MAAKFWKVICSAIIFYTSIDICPSRVDPPTASEKGAENVPNQPMRRECSATRDFFDPQDIDKAGYSRRGVKHGLGPWDASLASRLRGVVSMNISPVALSPVPASRRRSTMSTQRPWGKRTILHSGILYLIAFAFDSERPFLCP